MAGIRVKNSLKFNMFERKYLLGCCLLQMVISSSVSIVFTFFSFHSIKLYSGLYCRNPLLNHNFSADILYRSCYKRNIMFDFLIALGLVAASL